MINFRDILQSTFGPANAQVFKLWISRAAYHVLICLRKLTGHLALVHLVDSS